MRESKVDITILSLEVRIDDRAARSNRKESILGPRGVRFAVQSDRFSFAVTTPHTAQEQAWLLQQQCRAFLSTKTATTAAAGTPTSALLDGFRSN